MTVKYPPIRIKDHAIPHTARKAIQSTNPLKTPYPTVVSAANKTEMNKPVRSDMR